MNTLLETTRKLAQDLQRIGFGDPHVPINGAQCVDVVNDHYADLEAAVAEHDEPKRGQRAVKIITLDEAYAMLQNAAAVIWDCQKASLSIAPLTDEPDNEWLCLTIRDDAGYDFTCKFIQRDNEAVKVDGVCMVLTDHEGDDVKLTLLAGQSITAHPTPVPGAASRTTAKPTVPGWYWFWQQNDPDHKAEPEVVRMYQDGGGRLRFAETSVLATDTPQWCEWSGPILPGGAA